MTSETTTTRLRRHRKRVNFSPQNSNDQPFLPFGHILDRGVSFLDPLPLASVMVSFPYLLYLQAFLASHFQKGSNGRPAGVESCNHPYSSGRVEREEMKHRRGKAVVLRRTPQAVCAQNPGEILGMTACEFIRDSPPFVAFDRHFLQQLSWDISLRVDSDVR